MEKLGKLKLCLMVLPFVLFLNLSGAVGQKKQCIVPTIPENVEGIEELLALQWASGHPPAEIQPGTDAEVTVVAGFPPLQWSVSGNGFSLGEVEEGDVDHERSKLLIASPTACGPAKITVTDPHSAVIGYVRSTAGTWQSLGYQCCTPEKIGTPIYGTGTWIYIEGKYKQTQSVMHTSTTDVFEDKCASGWCDSSQLHQCGEPNHPGCQTCIAYNRESENPIGCKDGFLVPCMDCENDENPNRISCYKSTSLECFEWVCE